MAVRERLKSILHTYQRARSSERFGRQAPVWTEFEELEEALAELPEVRFYETLDLTFSVGKGRWAHLPWLAFLDRRETTSARRGVYCVFLFCEDMSGVYLTLAQGVTEPQAVGGREHRRAWFSKNKNEIRARFPQLAERFQLDDSIDLRGDSPYAEAYEDSVIAHKLYATESLPTDDEIEADLRLLLSVYRQYVDSQMKNEPMRTKTSFDLQAATEDLIASIAARGFHYEPWQVAAFVTALRTKPLVILAGVTGTGKSKLPALVAEAVGASCRITPVRSDWTDSGDVVGFTNLHGKFQPGALLRAAREARNDPKQMHFFVLDEMNIARIEHYAPELLSVIESRQQNEAGEFGTRPLLSAALSDEDSSWLTVDIPSNFAVIGTVNMDESSHPFSRKVLDRAFTIELSTIRLDDRHLPSNEPMNPVAEWPLSAWRPRAIQLAQLSASTEEENQIKDVIATLTAMNRCLAPAQLQIGYRSRDEIILFVTHANEIRKSFRDVDPLDLALHMKVLPRIIGGALPVRNAVNQLLGLARRGEPFQDEREAQSVTDEWVEAGRPESLPGSRFPLTAARLSMMFERFAFEGSTSFWL